jgi:hypothetical protein
MYVPVLPTLPPLPLPLPLLLPTVLIVCSFCVVVRQHLIEAVRREAMTLRYLAADQQAPKHSYDCAAARISTIAVDCD